MTSFNFNLLSFDTANSYVHVFILVSCQHLIMGIYDCFFRIRMLSFSLLLNLADDPICYSITHMGVSSVKRRPYQKVFLFIGIGSQVAPGLSWELTGGHGRFISSPETTGRAYVHPGEFSGRIRPDLSHGCRARRDVTVGGGGHLTVRRGPEKPKHTALPGHSVGRAFTFACQR